MTPLTDASTSTTAVVQLIPPQPVGDVAGARTSFLIEAIYMNFSVRRLLTSTIDALTFVVYQVAPTDGGNLPALALNSQSLEDRLYARKAIMMMAALPVPPNLGTSDLLAFTPSDEIMVAHHEYQANRKHDVATQVLALTINTDIDSVVRVFAQWRILVSWSR